MIPSRKRKKVKKIYYPEIGGIYLHYKGGKYEVITIAKHSETDENMVVYKSIHFGSFHVRPLYMWDELIEYKDKKVVRFELIGFSDTISFDLSTK